MSDDQKEEKEESARKIQAFWRKWNADWFWLSCAWGDGCEFVKTHHESIGDLEKVMDWIEQEPYSMLLKKSFWRGVIFMKERKKKALAEEIAALEAKFAAEDKATAEAKAAEQMYPPAMQATVDTEIEAALSYRSQTCCEEKWRQNNALERWLWSGKGGYNVGDHIEVLFNENQQTEALYSGEVIEVQYRGSMPDKIKVKFHYDGKVRKYTGEKFKLLKREGEEHKRKRGIEANFTGRIFTKLCSTKKKKKKAYPK